MVGENSLATEIGTIKSEIAEIKARLFAEDEK